MPEKRKISVDNWEFNCKVGNCIQGNTEIKTKGGRLLLKMVENTIYVWSMRIAYVKEYGHGSKTKKSLQLTM